MSDRLPPFEVTLRHSQEARQNCHHPWQYRPQDRGTRAVENASVVDVVRPAQVPNMAPSAVAQPPIVLTERDLLLLRQGGNSFAMYRGIELLSKQPRREPFHFCLFCSLLDSVLRRKAKQETDSTGTQSCLVVVVEK
ncbi:hypothetical protein PROFUN_14493 [Planoprotostelium fungivorum]|uniref:Uncharacterized protein n=1 Tax=Planoprotostelium fungivorum TaxID=1890364 RepID=A0A2P6MZH9_9EUKA|nr:hypothetical protein PROFUN_14493 [Planoprotostelium fungivorum]